MKRYQLHISTLLTAVTISLTGCSDDFDLGNRSDYTSDRGVVIYVPHVSQEAATRASEPSATRSDGAVWAFDDKEAVIKNVYLFAYPTSENADAEPVRCELTHTIPASDVPEGLENYTGYKVSLPANKYKMYVVANYDFPKDLDKISEGDLLGYPVTAPSYENRESLPMSCSKMQLLIDDDTYSEVSEIQIDPDNNQIIKADLKFAVSKVRLTVLNDLKPAELVSDVKLVNTYTQSYVIGGQENKNSCGDLRTSADISGEYYKMPTLKDEDNTSIDVKNLNVDGLTIIGNSPETGKPWAWQSTTYVGEYLFGSSVTNKPSMTLKIGGSALSPIELGGTIGMERSKFYDVIGAPNGKFIVEMQDWTPANMALALHGSYFLNIDNTDIDVQAGYGVPIQYSTNGPLSFDGNPTLDGTSTGKPIYDFSYNDDFIYVSLAPGVTKQEAIEYLNEERRYNWGKIRIQAGTIVKYIKVNEVTYDEFLYVDEDNVTIDVRVRIGTGSYNGAITIPIRTNLTEFTITRSEGWDDIINESYDVKSVALLNPAGKPLSEISETDGVKGNADGSAYTINTSKCVTNGIYNLRLAYTELNSGRAFWQEPHSMTLNIYGIDSDGEEHSYDVKVNILPNVDKYRVYLYAPSWQHPHIYVYEVLEFPSVMTSFPERAGQPVGAGSKNNDNIWEYGNVAALQYSFTGGVAFKGWDSEYNNPYVEDIKLEHTNGFYTYKEDESWNPGKTDWENHYYDFDFCAEYRSNIPNNLCGACKTNINRGWPGIVMTKEILNGTWTGWWYFDLSGVATPGKALVMFNDDHSNSSSRVPDEKNAAGKVNPGLALFDYSDRVGYLDATGNTIFNDKQFHPERPVPTEPQEYIYRIYWPYVAGQFDGLNLFDESETICNKVYLLNNFNNNASQDITSEKVSYHRDGQYAYVEIHKNSEWTSSNIQYQWKTGNDDGYANKTSISLNNFVDSGNNTFKYTIKPYLYRIWWNYNSSSGYQGYNIWGDGNTYGNTSYSSDNYSNYIMQSTNNGAYSHIGDKAVLLIVKPSSWGNQTLNYQRMPDHEDQKNFNTENFYEQANNIFDIDF